MELAFYLIERNDGGIVDTENDAPYIVCNDVEDAVDVLDKLPEIEGGYQVNVCTIDRDLAVEEKYCSTDQ